MGAGLGSSKGLSQDGGPAEFAKNLRASLFNGYLSHDTTVLEIHLDGQYLPLTS